MGRIGHREQFCCDNRLEILAALGRSAEVAAQLIVRLGKGSNLYVPAQVTHGMSGVGHEFQASLVPEIC